MKIDSTNRRVSQPAGGLRLFFLVFTSAACILFAAGVAKAATYYLDAVNGDDSNPGTSEAPWQTLNKATSTVISGDTVIVRNGSYGAYSEAYVDRTDWITYRAADGHSPEIANILIDNQGRSYDTYLSFDGFTIRPAVGKRSAIDVRNGRYTRFLNLNVIGQGASTTSYGFYGWGTSSDIVIDYCTFSGGNKTGRFDGFNTVIAATGCDNLVIANNEIRQFHYIGVDVSSMNVIVRNNNIHYCGADAAIGISGPGDGPILIENNKLYDLYPYQPVLSENPTTTTWSSDGKTMNNPNATWGVSEPIAWANNVEIWIKSGTNAKTGDNDIRIASVDSPTQITLKTSIKSDPSGPAPSNVDYILIDQTHGDLIQVYAYATVSNLTIRNNQFYDCEGQYGNISPWESTSGGIGGHNFLIENNLFWNSLTSGAEETNTHKLYMDHIDHLTFRNNIILGNATFTTDTNIAIYNNIIGYIYLKNVELSECDYNIYNRGFIESPHTQGAHDTFFYPNQYAWDKWNDPRFTGIFADYYNGDFRHASADSLGVGHSDPINSPSIDILGNPRDAYPDAGCYEYHGPVLENIGNKSVYVNDALNFTVNATDPDGDPITYSGENLPTGATFTGQTFSWTPTSDQVGTYQVTFIASDGSEQDSETITITVKSTNQAPTANAGPDHTVSDSDGNGSEQVTLDGSGSADSDGTIQSYVWSEGGTQIATGLNPTVTLAVGQHTITLTVTDDGGLTDTDTVTITVDSAPTTYTLTISASNGSVTKTPNKASYSSGETVSLQAVPNTGYHFMSWSGDLSGSTNPATITMNSNKSVTANFAANTYTLTINATNGSVTKTPNKASYSHGETVSLQAVPNTGYSFTSWSGDLSGSTNPATITMNSNKSVTANFSPIDQTAPSVTNCSPGADAIQVPVNSLVTSHVVDAGQGIDASTVTIKINGNIVYTGDTDLYNSQYGRCYRSGTKADYEFTYQVKKKFGYEQEIIVTVDATDLSQNRLQGHTYSFWTEMRSFGKNKKVSTSLSTVSEADTVTVSDSSGNIWAAWHAGPAGSRDIYLAKLAEGASSFGGSIQLTADPADQCNPAIALDGTDKLYVVWQDNRRGNWDIYVSTSVDGTNWSAGGRITDSNDNEINPAIAIDRMSPNRAHLVWQDDRAGNYDVYLATSSDAFATKTLSQITSVVSDQTEPAIAIDSGNTLYVVWTDLRNGTSDIYGAASNSGPWTNVPIVSKANNQYSPRIAVEADGSVLHLLWVDDTPGNKDIFYAATNGLPGSPLVGTSIIDDSSGANQLEPAIAVTGYAGNDLSVFACWQDWRNVVSSSDTDIYFVEITSDGKTNVFVDDDGTNANQSEPAMSVDRYGYPYIVWADSRSTNPQAYYVGSTYLSPEPLASQLVSASSGAIVGTNPASITSLDDVSIVVPAGACSCDMEITISRIMNPPEFAVPCLAAYDFGPSGIQFAQPVTITIPYAISGAGTLATPYWFNSLTGALSQQGITDIRDIVISPTLHALSFRTTHFTAFYLMSGSVGTAATDGGGGGGGCALSATGEGSVIEFLLPYLALAGVMLLLKLRDGRGRRADKSAEPVR
jgi:hypothetical protein